MSKCPTYWGYCYCLGSNVIDWCTENGKGASYMTYMFELHPEKLGMKLDNDNRFNGVQRKSDHYHVVLDDDVFKDPTNIELLWKMPPSFIRENKGWEGEKEKWVTGPNIANWDSLVATQFHRKLEDLCNDVEKEVICGSSSNYGTWYTKEGFDKFKAEWGEDYYKKYVKKEWDLQSQYGWGTPLAEHTYWAIRVIVKVCFKDDPTGWKMRDLNTFVQEELGEKFNGFIEFLKKKETKARPRKKVDHVKYDYNLQDQYGTEIEIGDTVVYPWGSDHYYCCKKAKVTEINYLQSSDKKEDVLEKSFITVKEEDSKYEYGSKTLARKVVVVKKANGNVVL